jgi:hypothetical protein
VRPRHPAGRKFPTSASHVSSVGRAAARRFFLSLDARRPTRLNQELCTYGICPKGANSYSAASGGKVDETWGGGSSERAAAGWLILAEFRVAGSKLAAGVPQHAARPLTWQGRRFALPLHPSRLSKNDSPPEPRRRPWRGVSIFGVGKCPLRPHPTPRPAGGDGGGGSDPTDRQAAPGHRPEQPPRPGRR